VTGFAPPPGPSLCCGTFPCNGLGRKGQNAAHNQGQNSRAMLVSCLRSPSRVARQSVVHLRSAPPCAMLAAVGPQNLVCLPMLPLDLEGRGALTRACIHCGASPVGRKYGYVGLGIQQDRVRLPSIGCLLQPTKEDQESSRLVHSCPRQGL
jgi:hypothetical protein